jgi:hypothetical protein
VCVCVCLCVCVFVCVFVCVMDSVNTIISRIRICSFLYVSAAVKTRVLMDHFQRLLGMARPEYGVYMDTYTQENPDVSI